MLCEEDSDEGLRTESWLFVNFPHEYKQVCEGIWRFNRTAVDESSCVGGRIKRLA